LARLAAEWRAPLSASVFASLLRFGELLMEWNARINLTGSKTLVGLVDEHLPDAFAVASVLTEPATVIDVGSGGGLPAVPLAVLRPTLRLTLVEPLAKKAAFLRTAVRELGLGGSVTVEARRVEDLAPASFDVAMSRATFPPPVWVELAQTLVRPGGRVLVLTVPGVELAGERLRYFGGRRELIQVQTPECST
jgi:16S rRNA (guanine527-N7)-methyltransferase